MKKIKALLLKYREIIVYVISGALTTVVNLVVFKLFNMLIGVERYLISNIFAWFFSVVFAYIINKLWVFESKSWGKKVLLREIPSFFSARVISFFVEEAGLYLLVDVFLLKNYSLEFFGIVFGGEMISKAFISVIVVIINYIFSKLVIFRKNS